MKTKQIFIALIIFILLFGYYYIFEIKKKKEDAIKKEQQEKMFPNLKKENISEIYIKNENGKFTFKKIGTEWKLFEPIDDFADNAAVDGILNAFEHRKVIQKIEKANPEDFGLKQNYIEAEVKTIDNRSFKLNIGEKNPTGIYVYVSKPDMPDTVYITDTDIKTWCEKKLFDYRFRYILKVDENKVTRIEVNLKDKKYTVEKKDGVWNLVNPFKGLARKDRVDSFISSFKTAMAKSMEEGTPANLKKYELENPKEYIKFFEDDKEHIIYIGKNIKDKYSYFVKTNRIKEILEMPDYVYTNLTKAEDMLNKQVIIFEQDKVKKIEIKINDKFILAEKVKDKKGVDNWEYKQTKNIKDDEKKRISMWTISSELFNSEYKEKIKVDEKVNEKEKYGIDEKIYIKLIDAENKVIGTALIGKKVEGKEEIYIKVPERNEIYTIEARHITSMSLPGLEIK